MSIGVKWWAIACGMVAALLTAIGVTIATWQPAAPGSCRDSVQKITYTHSPMECEHPDHRMQFVTVDEYSYARCNCPAREVRP